MESQALRKARADLGVAVRLKRPPAVRDEARQRLAVAQLESYISKIVADAPPLSDEQAAKIAALLRAGGAGPNG